MPGTRCAVSVCNNSLVETKKKNLEITYHTFPKDEQIFDEWVKACCRKDKWNPKTSVICSEHFKEEDFAFDLKAKLLNIKGKRKLKPTAVPTLHLRSKSKTSQINPKKKHIKKRRKEKMELDSDENCEESTTEPDPLTPVETFNEDVEVTDVSHEERLQDLINEHEALKASHKALQDSFENQKNELESTQKLLASVAAKLEAETLKRQQVEETLSKVLNTSEKVVVVVKKEGDDDN